MLVQISIGMHIFYCTKFSAKGVSLADTRRWTNVVLKLAHHLQHWLNISCLLGPHCARFVSVGRVLVILSVVTGQFGDPPGYVVTIAIFTCRPPRKDKQRQILTWKVKSYCCLCLRDGILTQISLPRKTQTFILADNPVINSFSLSVPFFEIAILC